VVRNDDRIGYFVDNDLLKTLTYDLFHLVGSYLCTS
jgi:hypothetical protein